MIDKVVIFCSESEKGYRLEFREYLGAGVAFRRAGIGGLPRA